MSDDADVVDDCVTESFGSEGGDEVLESSCVFIPQCDESLKPFVGQLFKSMEDGVEFYKNYARLCGFDIRMGTSRVSSDKKCVLFRYIYCNREGEKNYATEDVNYDGDDVCVAKRRRVSMRTSCAARIVINFKGCKGFEVSKFVHQHNHSFVSDGMKMFQKLGRKVGYGHQKFVLDCARANIGPMKSFRFFKETVGNYKDIGCAYVDFRNISRDLKAFVEGSDAQMVINIFCKRKEFNPAFYFAYEVDHEDKLKNLFWCDPISKLNYVRFGDVVSFDATYSTNRYNLIFAPFTGKDNHGKCVNFGAALICREDASSYSWVFQKFLDCMGVPPKIIVTDQDLGMKAAVERVLGGTRHRLCLWHIMLKVPDKVPTSLKKDDSFNKRLSAVVWSEELEPGEFEAEWKEIMDIYGLKNDGWFSNMYEIRCSWVPAFFRDLPMSGLMKTTSVSESSNSFFGRYSSARSNLLQFVMNYESAIDSQRYANANMNYIDEKSNKNLKTSMAFEKQAASLYTSSIFRDVQDDIIASLFECRVISAGPDGMTRDYVISDKWNVEYTVSIEVNNGIFRCSCKKFVRFGLLCSHIFCGMKNASIDYIPDKYIVGRWCDSTYDRAVHSDLLLSVQAVSYVDEAKILSGKLVSEFYNCLGLVEGKRDYMEEFLRSLAGLSQKFSDGGGSVGGNMSKQNMFEKFYGSSVPEEVSIHPPYVVKTKGSGSRLISRKEKAIRVAAKPLRKCSVCKKLTNHDARNCKKINVEIEGDGSP